MTLPEASEPAGVSGAGVEAPPSPAGEVGAGAGAGVLLPPSPPQPDSRVRTIIMARTRLTKVFFMVHSFLSQKHFPAGAVLAASAGSHFSLFPL